MDTAQEKESGAEAPEVDPVARPRLGPDGIRASLEAVRSAQAAARARARSETRWARAIAAGAVMIVGVTAWAAAHRPTRAAAPSVAAVAPVPIAAPPLEPAPREAPPAAPVAAATERPAAAAPADASERAASCDAAFAQRSWTAIASTCAAAFEARPSDGALAMRVAQAQHRRGHIAAAAEWARKALALDAEIPEAYVIVAHAETNAGQGHAAAAAYRHYLALAPRGWHAAEARRALRAERYR